MIIVFGDRLKELRKANGWSQKELAVKLSLSWRTISSYETENSTPNHEILVEIARIFDISLDYLLGLIKEETSYRRPKCVIDIPSNLTNAEILDVQNFASYLAFKKTPQFQRLKNGDENG